MIVIHLENRGSQWCSPAQRMPEKPDAERLSKWAQMCGACIKAARAASVSNPATHFTVLADGSTIDHGLIDYAADHNRRLSFLGTR